MLCLSWRTPDVTVERRKVNTCCAVGKSWTLPSTRPANLNEFFRRLPLPLHEDSGIGPKTNYNNLFQNPFQSITHNHTTTWHCITNAVLRRFAKEISVNRADSRIIEGIQCGNKSITFFWLKSQGTVLPTFRYLSSCSKGWVILFCNCCRLKYSASSVHCSPLIQRQFYASGIAWWNDILIYSLFNNEVLTADDVQRLIRHMSQMAKE